MIEKQKQSSIIAVIFLSLALITIVVWVLVIQNETARTIDGINSPFTFADTIKNLNLAFASFTILFIIFSVISSVVAISHLNKLINTSLINNK